MVNPGQFVQQIRASKIRTDQATLEQAAVIATAMNCHALANSLRRLSEAKGAELQEVLDSLAEQKSGSLTRVSRRS